MVREMVVEGGWGRWAFRVVCNGVSSKWKMAKTWSGYLCLACKHVVHILCCSVVLVYTCKAGGMFETQRSGRMFTEGLYC